MSSPARLGIDFGTSHTVAVLNRGGIAVPVLFDSSPILPSAVYAEPDGSLLVGADAVNASRLEPARFEPNPKRRVDDGLVLLGDREFAVEDLFAAVLARVHQECERVLGTGVVEATLTHPAAWGSARRLVLEDAAHATGFHNIRLVPEPVAAATFFTHVLRHEVPQESAVMVADLGGGTFDASVVVNTPTGFTVQSVDGIENLGGVDIDHALFTLLGERFTDSPDWARLTDPTTTEERRARRALSEDVRAAKERLSRHNRVEFPVPLVGRDTHVTRDELEALTRPLLERAIRVTTAVVRAARLPSERHRGLLLVGGASRMPLVAGMLHSALDTAPTVLEQPELVVAQGATLVGRAEVTATPVAPLRIPAQTVAKTAVHSPPMASPPITPRPPTVTTDMPAVHHASSGPQTPAAPPHKPGTPQMPTSLRVVRALAWLHALGACAVWLPAFSIVFEYGLHRPEYIQDEALAIMVLAVSPLMIGLAVIILCIAVFRFKRRTPGAHRLAFAPYVAAIISYPVLAGFIAVRDDAFITMTLGLLLVLWPSSIAGALVLKTETASRWFNLVSATNDTRRRWPELPASAQIARALMWIHVGVGLVWAFVFTGFLGDQTYYYIDSDHIHTDHFFSVMLIFMPLLATACLVSISVAAVNLSNRRPVIRTFAVAINTISVAYYAFSLISLARFESGNHVTTSIVGLLLIVALAITSAALLSTNSARHAFTTPSR